MPRIAYVDGRYRPLASASVSIEDRGFQFADGIYEVIAVRGGRLVDGREHFGRLDRSLAEVEIGLPLTHRALAIVIDEVLRRNGVRDGMVYLQVTRGRAPRNHLFPEPRPRPTVVVTARSIPVPAASEAGRGVEVVTLPDIRWRRCDIKSVSLLPNVLAREAARRAGAYEAWLVDATGHVTEGTASNAWMVAAGGVIVTRPPGPAILNGITRGTLIRLAGEAGLAFEERPFTAAEAKAAPEAFLSGTISLVKPVVRIDGEVIGNGRPGPVTEALLERYLAYLAKFAEETP